MSSPVQKQYNGNFSFSSKEGRDYLSPVFDSGAPATSWDRLVLHMAEPSPFQVKIFISDCPPDAAPGTEAPGIKRPEPAIVSKYTDVLLYTGGVKGRNLQFILSGNARFNGYSVRYPKVTFTDYLPEIYRRNEVLERFMAVFQNEYLDREDEIGQFYRQLDPLECREEFTGGIAELLGAEALLFAQDETRRSLLRNASLLNRLKGTANSVKLLVYLITGSHAFVMEEPGRNHFSIFIPEKPKPWQESLLHTLLPVYIPYPMDCSLCYSLLDSVLDGHSYIGYCCCSQEVNVIVGKRRLGELLCL